MTIANESDSQFQSRFDQSPRQTVSVHVLSEHVFCPRAAMIASEAGNDGGDEEPNMGPRLDCWIDFDEHKFVEALAGEWGRMRLWLTLMAVALSVVMLGVWFHSRLAGVLLSLPVFILVAKCWDTLTRIIALVREQALFRSAPDVLFDPQQTEVQRLSWWTLRKAGFDCNKPPDPLTLPDDSLAGKPWRLLRKGSMVVPVIRRRQGTKEWGSQHAVRLAAYCDLIGQCMGAASPFGVILFSGTNECAILPNTRAQQKLYKDAMRSISSYQILQSAETHIPAAPNDRRCLGCPHGKPRRYQAGQTETILDGRPMMPFTTNVHRGDGQLIGSFHSPCGDRFQWIPRHQDAINLGIVGE